MEPVEYTPDVAAAIEDTVRILSGYTFPGLGREDLSQQVRLYCWEALPKWNPSRGELGKYLWSYARCRVLNLKRDKFFRAGSPCPDCENGSPCTPDGCEKHRDYLSRNITKANLYRARSIYRNQKRHFDRHPPADSILECEELRELIERHLDPAILPTFRAHLHGDRCRGTTLMKLRREVANVLTYLRHKQAI